ncbi:hypothetical protein QR680_001675 [Steinernema hermaphroditum]|uniref:Ras-GEF domain-containing protein n=1 Tax=Steinernema hermaphroditum TaxID=289476 RepID=A0AA39LGF2_9BILA|nr:hypothetical protein QR680_001675 [Steinernema hermaphroditum]
MRRSRSASSGDLYSTKRSTTRNDEFSETPKDMFNAGDYPADYDLVIGQCQSSSPCTIKARIKDVLGKISLGRESPRHRSSPSRQMSTSKTQEHSTKKVDKMDKELTLAIRYFQETVRNGQVEMYSGCITALFNAVLQYLTENDTNSDVIKSNLYNILKWFDKEIVEYLNNPVNYKKSTECFHADESSKNVQLSTPTQTLTSLPAAKKGPLNEDAFDELLRQLNIRKVEKFQPQFPPLDDSDDDENSFHVDEEREERAEKHGARTCVEQVENRPDGSRSTTRRTRTVNVQQTTKSVTIRKHGGGADEFVKRFTDGSHAFNDDSDFESGEVFSRPFGLRSGGLRSMNDFGFSSEPNSTSSAQNSDNLHTTTKSIEHVTDSVQSVSRQAKRNGKIIADDAAHKVDTSEIKAKQIEMFKDNKLLARQGHGTYEEGSVVRQGLADMNTPPILPPKKRHVVQYMQTFGNGSDEADEATRSSTLSSYIALIDNLKYHEEQYSKEKRAEFGSPSIGGVLVGQEFTNLSRLLQNGDLDRVLLPSKFVDDECEQQKSITYPKLLAITSGADVLEALDVTEWLVLRAKDEQSKPTELRGGPRDALIVYATQPAGSLLYQEAFLTTYRTFVTSQELIQKLIKRYHYTNQATNSALLKSARQTFSVLVRVVDELCAVELNRLLIETVTSFVYKLILNGEYIFARILRKRLMDRIEHKSGFKANASFFEYSPSSKTPSLFDFSSTAVARQMTFLDSELFQRIEPAEMLWWSKEQDEKKSPNLIAFTEHFNNVSYWVRSLVILQGTQKEREKYFLKFVKVMKNLRKMGNFNSYLAILSALDSGPIRRLDWSKTVQEHLREHISVMDSSHSFKNYRTLLAETKPPCLPYIGLVLQDLTFVHVGNTDCLPKSLCQNRSNLLNFGKRWQQFAILDSIRRFKIWTYSLQKDEKILRLFGKFKEFLSEDDIWERSETIKPRMRKNK